MKYFIGIDGGGTKTAFLCYNEEHSLIGETELSTVHFMQVCGEEAVVVLKRGIGEILPESADKKEVFLCAGFGGYGKNPMVRRHIEDICARSFEGMRYCIRNDGDIALKGAFDGEDGILIIAGTGSIGLAKKGDKRMRCGGWGYLLGDEGSAYWIGKKLLETFCRQNDGRKQRTKLSGAVMARLGLTDAYDLIPYINENQDRGSVADLAMVVYELAQTGDEAALDIYREAAKWLAGLANSLAEHFEGECCVSYGGSVWKAGKYIMDPMRHYLDSHIEIVPPKHTPVYGAYLIAREM